MQAFNAGSVKGFDVSHHNGSVDFQQAKDAGYSFVYLKASEGSGYVDPTYLSNVKAAKAAGLLVGAYHFARPGTNDAIAEAKHFVGLLNKASTDLLPVLDLEASTLNALQTAQWALKFIAYVVNATGRRVMLYTGAWFVDQFGGFANMLSHLPLWISYYRTTSAPPNVGGWNAWTVWQYTETGAVPGVNGACDVNVAISLEAITGKASGQIMYKEVKEIPLSVGAKGDLVKQVQQWLEVNADGLFGHTTEASVRDWQAAHDKDGKPGHGLEVNGVVDAATWRALNLAKTGKDPYAAKPTVAPQPEAKPQPKPEAKPAPAPAPTPAPQPQPVQQPAEQPKKQSEAKPAPLPEQPKPQPEPKPVPLPEPASAPQQQPAPIVLEVKPKQPEKSVEPQPEPKPEQVAPPVAPEPQPEPQPAPVIALAEAVIQSKEKPALLAIDWKSRIRNRWFLAAVAAFTLRMLTAHGVLDNTVAHNYEDLINGVLDVLTVVGIVIDPTTKGVGDNEEKKQQ